MKKLGTLLTILCLSTLTVGCAPSDGTDTDTTPAADTGAPATPPATPEGGSATE